MATKTPPESADSSTTTQQLQDLTIEALRVQIAATTSMIKFWTSWAQSAEKFAKDLSDELDRISKGEPQSESLLVRLSDLTREQLREMGKLPNVAAEHFKAEIDKLPKPKRPPRVAKAKE